MQNAISVSSLTKNYDEVRAVDGISFEIKEGELFGFLGPNGAGKTTTISMLTGLARPDEGEICIADIDCSKNVKSAQHLMGVVPDESNLYPELTGFENLCFCGALYGMKKQNREQKARELLEKFSLTEAGGRKFAGYSKGMKRKLVIAAGIIHDPPILFLDEPTTGIDVASTRLIRQLIIELNNSGKTIFLTTHYIEEAERLCQRIAFIVSGKIVRIDSVENLLQQVKGRYVVQFTVSKVSADLCSKIELDFPDMECELISNEIVQIQRGQPILVAPLVRFFEDQGVEVTEARKVRPSLEDVFVKITDIKAEAMKKEKEKAGGKA
ncbi:TPA: ABC transporter ATP-binding protein [bacterium]|nr:ABC transporter ATP-binding protein [bacterium]